MKISKIPQLLSIVIFKLIGWDRIEGYAYMVWEKNPLIKENDIGSKRFYMNLYKSVKNKKYPEVDQLEKNTGYSINKKWFHELALHTQIVKKKTSMNYQHGKVLYSLLREYIKDSKVNSLNILETGTARGFSTLCMAKAFEDSGTQGKIVTLDVLPHNVPIYWNCIDDNEGKKSRKKLLEKYKKLIDRYIIFFQNYSETGLKRLDIGRVNFAYLDGQHTYNAIFKEIEYVATRQVKGDVIVFDDYDEISFPGVVKAVDESMVKYGYKTILYRADRTVSRYYLHAIKK